MEVIKKWLASGKVYKVGVAIYNELGTDPLLKRLLTSEAETPYKKDRLVKALQALVSGKQEQVKEIAAQSNDQSTAVASVASHRLQWPRDSCKDATEVEMWEKAVVLLKERAHLHSILFTAQSDDERRTIAFQLLRKDDALDAIYAGRKYYLKHGKLEERDTNPEYVTDPGIMVTRVSNLQRYISRYRQKLEKGADSDVQAKLDAVVKEYNHYARIMGKEEVKC